MYTLLHLVVLTVTVLALARLMPTIQVKSGSTAVVVAVVFSSLNWLMGWFIKALLVVPVILTLGLLLFFVPFIVNTVILWLTDKVLHAFEIKDTRSLLVASAAITVVSGALHMLVNTR